LNRVFREIGAKSRKDPERALLADSGRRMIFRAHAFRRAK
jgi:hypothetical protein